MSDKTTNQPPTLEPRRRRRSSSPTPSWRTARRTSAPEQLDSPIERRPRHLGHVHPRVRRPAAGALAPLPPAHSRAGDRTGAADRARRPARQGTARQLQPAPGRVQRAALPEPGTAPGRPRPGGHARADPRQREVRLAQGLPLLAPTPRCGSGRRSSAVWRTPDARSGCPCTSPSARARSDGSSASCRSGSGASRRSRSWPRRRACRSSRSRRCATSAPPWSASTSRSAKTATPPSETCCPPTSEAPEETAWDNERERIVHEAISQLPDTERTVLTLRFGTGPRGAPDADRDRQTARLLRRAGLPARAARAEEARRVARAGSPARGRLSISRQGPRPDNMSGGGPRLLR